jgi:hypothetical protein
VLEEKEARGAMELTKEAAVEVNYQCKDQT